MQSRNYVSHGISRLYVWGQHIRYSLVYWLGLLLLFIFSVIVLAPLVWTMSTSLSLPIESYRLPPRWIPDNPEWSNYLEVFRQATFGRYIINSAVVTASIVVGQLVMATLAGYAFAQLEFPGKGVLFWVVMATMMLPLQATIVPVFVLVSKLGLSDTLAGLILPACPTAFGTFLLRQYFLTIPKEFEEAAVIDGASPLQVFFQVFLPLVASGQAVLAVLAFNGYWNEFFRPLVFLSSQDKLTLPLGLIRLRGYEWTGSVSVVLAGVVLSLIPVLIIYLLGQRFLIEGIMMGGLKG